MTGNEISQGRNMILTSKQIRTLFSFSFVLFLIQTTGFAQNELDVIKDNWLEFTDAPNALYRHLTGQAYELLERRVDNISGISNLNAWQERQQEIREILSDIVGPFPPKTPLNPQVTRIIDKKSYRVEHVIFESQPGFYVTSSLFIPAGLKGKTKAPAVIYCSGHSVEGYRSQVYQYVILNLVSKGFIVFAFDPVGQGERLEYYSSDTGNSIIGGPTKEHSYPGAQAFIAGSSQAMYMIWDGIRAVDYLLTRKEVDPSRIGITGRSGGGTQSAYIAAFDDRIYAVAPENYITNYTRLLQSIGPQDAEQNLFNLIYRGIDHPDFLIVRAPKPALMITTTRDMFSIQGAIETEREVSRIYKAYGREDNFARTEDDAGHESTLKNRESMYSFFQKHLANPGNPRDEQVQLLTAEELKVTATGQLATSVVGETVFSLNKKIAENLAAELNNSRKDPGTFLSEVIKSAKELSGYIEPSTTGEPVFSGRIARENYSVEKYFIKGEGNYVIPYLLFVPSKPGNKGLIYLHPAGKSAEAGTGGEIERIVREGVTVLSPDLPGTGELGSGSLHGDAYFDGVSHNLWYAALLIRRSITGIQAGEIVRLAGVLRKRNNEGQISVCARKELAPALLHAAAFTNEISRVILIEPCLSYLSIVTTRFYNPVLINSTVPGALKRYDLPDLAACLVPRKLMIMGTTGADGTYSQAEINKDLEFIRKAYISKNTESLLVITPEVTIEKVLMFLKD